MKEKRGCICSFTIGTSTINHLFSYVTFSNTIIFCVAFCRWTILVPYLLLVPSQLIQSVDWPGKLFARFKVPMSKVRDAWFPEVTKSLGMWIVNFWSQSYKKVIKSEQSIGRLPRYNCICDKHLISDQSLWFLFSTLSLWTVHFHRYGLLQWDDRTLQRFL